MRAESLVLAVSGAFFGLLVGWMLGSQQIAGPRPAPAPASATATQTTGSSASTPQPVDAARIAELRAAAQQDSNDSASRVALGNLYFDAERYSDAIQWYEAALAIDPNDADVSTDLGVAYYYTDDVDRALTQFAHSLDVDPTHVKTLLNIGIVLAFGKQDLEGAARAWEQVVNLAPDSPEGRAARQAIDSMRGAHPGFGETGEASSSGGAGGG